VTPVSQTPRRATATARARAQGRRKAPPKLDIGRLVGYSITGLFGGLDYEFELEVDEPTILTGANGTGKSTILRTVNAVASGSWAALARMPFKSLALTFERGPQLRVKRTKSALTVTYGKREPFELDFRGPSSKAALFYDEATQYALQDKLFEHPIEELSHAERDRQMRLWRRMRDDLAHTPVPAPPDWIDSFTYSFHVQFITDQRLVIQDSDRPGPPGRRRSETKEEIRKAVAEYGDDLGSQMGAWLKGYATASQREDRAFPQLVVEALLERSEVDRDELDDLLHEVAERRAALQAVGLVEADEETGPRFATDALSRPDVAIVMKTFAEVTLRKFDTLEALRTRLDLFVNFLIDHFVGKRPVTSAETGLMFTLRDGTTLRPSQLSSGEQQMLVLAYQLLFESAPGTLLLIDEPEISLHVGWQSTFIEDITEMGRQRRLQFLLATHSPTLIGGREDLKRPLEITQD
jgi:ABC-type cobalamin/Fe3+-siderophores transport system ATPase subunit